MPLVSESKERGVPAGIPVADPVLPKERGILEIGQAALESENSFFSTLAFRRNNRDFTPEPFVGEFDPVEYIEEKGYQPYIDYIGGYESPEQMDRAVYAIQQEEQNNRVISEAGWTGVAAVFGSAVMDPITLGFMSVPGGAPTKLARALQTAGLTAVGEGLAETALHATQETRTGVESALNIGAATFLGGMVGRYAGKMTQEEAQTIIKKANAEFEVRSVGAAGVGEVEKAGPATKFLQGFSPVTRLMAARTNAARVTASKLIETPFGGKNGALSTAAETNIKAWDAQTYRGQNAVANQWKAYKSSVPRGKRMNRAEFEQSVTSAMRRGDESDIPQVKAAATEVRKIFDSVGKQLEELGFLDELGQPLFAKSYVPRIYNHIAIRERQGEFRDFLANKFAEGDDALEVLEAQAAAEDTIRKILHADSRPGYTASKPGAAKGRKLAISDEELEPWLSSDINTIISRHIDGAAPAIEIKRAFGSLDLADDISKIRDEYAALANKADNPKERAKINKEAERVVTDIKAMRDLLLGTYGRPTDPISKVTTAGRIARKVNFLRLLGGMTLSALPDMANFVMRNGLAANFRVFSKMFQDFGRVGISKADMRRAGVGLDMTLNTRAKLISETGNFPAAKADAYMDKLTRGFGKVTLMTPWNATMKTWAGFLAQDSILRAAKSLDSGRGLSKGVRRRLNNLGLDDDMLKRIRQQTRLHGDEGGGLSLSRTDKWDDAEAAVALDRALLKEADITIVTPGAGDLPLAMRGEAGKLIGQFKSFAFAATNRMLYSGLYKNDLAFYNGLMLSVSLGVMAHIIKATNAGYDISWEPEDLISNGLDRSGILGILMEVNNTAEKVSGGQIGLSALTGATPMSRYASRGAVSALVGPTLGLGEDIGKIGYAMANEGMRKSDVHTMRKLLPYNNLFYTRRILDEAEKNIANAIGAE